MVLFLSLISAARSETERVGTAVNEQNTHSEKEKENNSLFEMCLAEQVEETLE